MHIFEHCNEKKKNAWEGESKLLTVSVFIYLFILFVASSSSSASSSPRLVRARHAAALSEASERPVTCPSPLL